MLKDLLECARGLVMAANNRAPTRADMWKCCRLQLIGATNPLEAEPGTIRGDLAVQVGGGAGFARSAALSL